MLKCICHIITLIIINLLFALPRSEYLTLYDSLYISEIMLGSSETDFLLCGFFLANLNFFTLPQPHATKSVGMTLNISGTFSTAMSYVITGLWHR